MTKEAEIQKDYFERAQQDHSHDHPVISEVASADRATLLSMIAQLSEALSVQQ